MLYHADFQIEYPASMPQRDSLNALDTILLDLPIMKEHGQHVQVEVTPLHRFEDFATDVKKAA